MRMILQAGATERGLASLAMVADHYGMRVGLTELRRRFPLSLKGARLNQLINIFQQIGLSVRPLRLDMKHLDELQLPCILHWKLNHYVVLTKVNCLKVSDLTRTNCAP